MQPLPGADWREANQRYLITALRLIRDALACHRTHAAHANDGDAAALVDAPARDGIERELAEIRSTMTTPPALALLCQGFTLSPFERDTLLLAAGVELHAEIAELCTAIAGDPRATAATFGLALAALPGAHWSALTPRGPLRRWHLVDVPTGGSLTRGPLRIDERVLHYLAGVSQLDERLAALTTPLAHAAPLAPSQDPLVRHVIRVWSQSGSAGLVAGMPIISLLGDDLAAQREIARRAGSGLGLSPLEISGADIPGAPAEQTLLARLLEREAVLSAALPVIHLGESDQPEGGWLAHVARLLDQLSCPVVVLSRERLPRTSRPAVRLDVPRPRTAEQRALWQTALGEHAAALNGHLERITAQFHLGAASIQAASIEVTVGDAADPDTAAGALWDTCRRLARPRLDDLAQRIEPSATWDDLVLPQPQLRMLREMAAHVRQRATVYDTWGFARRAARGLGITTLFTGASGTGKTFAAEVLANELRLDLYRVDLSATVSKYIGETEKNLRRIFDAAEEGGAILLFDEADALFGKRSEVRDSHDRYANIEVSYLLQRMEAYRGLAILTTNLKSALDTAFLRRIRFVVHFPFPDAAQRAEIWRRIFPAETPTEGLDVSLLARLNVAGGNIRNIALNAAFLAADAGEPVRIAHLLAASRGEYAKLEKPLTEAEIGGWP